MAINNLWGQEFEIPSKSKQDKIIKKINNPKKTKTVSQSLKSKSVTIEEKLHIIEENVNRILGGYSSNTIVIKTHKELTEYIDKSIANGIIAIDTETNNSLDPLTCKLMGACIYTPGMSSAYIPINHVDLTTHNRLEWQLTENDIKEQFDRLHDTNIIMHNGKFDYQVIHCTCSCDLNIYWDTMIGAKVLNETERAGLKQQYIEKIDNSIEKYSIDHLFDIEYAIVNPELFALYAATDAFMTYKLYEYQFNEFSKPENSRLYNLFSTIEMPVVPVVAEMELTGVCIDQEYSKRLSIKYHKMYDEVQKNIDKELSKYSASIAAWRLTSEANEKAIKNGKEQKSKNEQLDDPINVSSPTQLAILLYDVLKTPVVDKKTPRGTGEPVLKKIDLPICKLILESRRLLKLINTYIDKLPNCVSPVDNRLHAHFNQFGADTGRFSSSDPNLQNIPSKNHEIRMMFTAQPGYIMVGSDFSQQEPRLLSHYSQDKNMIDTYVSGKDLYSMIASKVYHNKYEDNLQNSEEGKQRRTSVKAVLLGIMYGRGTASIAENLKCSYEEADEIRTGFFKEFPNVEKWINETQQNARLTGYVEDVWGRRRRLQDIQKEKYEIELKNPVTNFNPLLGAFGKYNPDVTNKINNYKNKLLQCKSRKEIEQIKQEANYQGVVIKDNGGFIAQAERQCVNARIQGGAASMSKRAMVRVFKNQELKDLGFKLLIAVHDELIGECPIENAEKVKEILSFEMIQSALPEVTVPMKCDAVEFKSWYLDEYTSELKKELSDKGKYKGDFEKLCAEHTEYTSEQLKNILNI